MARSHRFGRLCEDLAASLLTDRGWTILARNYRLGHKEIDIIMRRGNIVAFVEVKGRSGPNWGHPIDAINGLKRREIEHVARSWIHRHGRAGETYRFDAVSVTRTPGHPASLEHLEDAWRPGN